jgi:predicted HicB family RNase H-like nuclease
MSTSKPKAKPKKPGRPKLAKADARGTIVPVRFSPEEHKRIKATARANKQNVSEWIRCTLAAAIGK